MIIRALFIGVVWLTASLTAAATTGRPDISVQETAGGTYVVVARFSVPEKATTVRAVLTDYESIPRFLPDVQISRVLAREDGHVRVEQEAVSKFMLFSKRVHLVLDVRETPDVIAFRDRCGKSFIGYEGMWTLVDRGDRTDIEYTLAAKPAFGVPGFVLRKLLNRDARAMIEGLRSEVRIRALAGE